MKKIALALLFLLSGCTSASNVLNPFYEPPSPIALQGQPNDHALNDSGSRSDSARAALDSLATYEAAHYPGPHRPVFRPEVIRMIWVPERLDRSGNLVQAHYQYIRVKSGDFAVQDAFEIERQLGSSGAGSNFSYTSRGR